MKHCTTLLFASVAYGAVIQRQAPPPPPKGAGGVGDVVGGALSTAGTATSAAGQGLNGLGPVTDIPKGVLEGVGSGLSSAGQAAKGTSKGMSRKVRRQAVGDLGGIVGETGSSWAGTLPGGILETIGAQFRKRQNPPNPADVVGGVGSGLQQGAQGASNVPGSGAVNSVGSGLQQGAKGAKDGANGPKLAVRQDTSTLGQIANGALQAAGGITSTVGAGLGAAKGSNDEVANAGTIVSEVGETLSGLGGAKSAKAPKSVRRQLPPAKPTPPMPKSAGPPAARDPPLPPKNGNPPAPPGKVRRQLLPPPPPKDPLNPLAPKGVLPPPLAPKSGLPPPPPPGAVGTAVGGALEAAGEAVGSVASSIAGKGPKMSRRQAKDAAGQATGGALQAAGGITGAVADGLRGGGPVTAPAADAVGSVSSGLNSAGAGAKGGAPKMHKRQAKDAAGQATGGALQAAGGITGAVADGLRSGGPVTAPAADAVGSVSSGLNSAGAGAKGGAPKMQRRQAKDAAGQVTGGALQGAGGITGAVADGLRSGGPVTQPAADAVGSVSSGLNNAGAGAKGGAPKMHRRQAKDAAGQVTGGALQGAGGVTGAVADGLRGGGAPTQPAADAVGSVSSGLNNAGAGAKGGAPKMYKKRQAPPQPKNAGGVGGAVADTAAGALQAASGVTEAVGDGLKAGGPITAPAGDAVNGVAQGLNNAAGTTRGGAKGS